MTQKEKFEPAGSLHKFFGEQVPDGFYWVLVDAKYNGQVPDGFYWALVDAKDNGSVPRGFCWST